jgi:hypothetical protein
MIKELNPLQVIKMLKDAGLISSLSPDRYVITNGGEGVEGEANKWHAVVPTFNTEFIICPSAFKDIKISFNLATTDIDTAMAVLSISEKIEGYMTINITGDNEIILYYNFLVDVSIEDIKSSVIEVKQDIQVIKDAMTFISMSMGDIGEEDDDEYEDEEDEGPSTEDQIFDLELDS